ncbi:MAG: urease accessory protein UreF [Proteobacteria bacterium]|nr:urease accessory protein UreF [Pseudomonadota bacterium]
MSAEIPGPSSALLHLLWLASPALPVGGFSYSEGLEAAIEAGVVTGEDAARRWLVDQLHLGLARSELPIVAASLDAWQHRDGTTLHALNDWVIATRETRELRLQSEQMGRSLAEWMKVRRAAIDDTQAGLLQALTPPTWPVAFALALAISGAALPDALQAHAFAWAENMVQAALKAVPLGQSAGQRILAALVAEIPAAVAHAIVLDAADRQAYMPMLAILSSRHETQYSRLFRS